MTEADLKHYLITKYPVENESCEWKEFKSLKHSFSGKAGDDIISYISALSNMEGGHLVLGIEDGTHNIIGIQDFNNHTAQSIKLRLVQVKKRYLLGHKCMEMKAPQPRLYLIYSNS